MSLSWLMPTCLPGSFPRVSGDEPALFELLEARLGFSPRERG